MALEIHIAYILSLERILLVSETDLAYLAGLIDGEGCVSIWRHIPRQCHNYHYGIHFTVGMTSLRTVEWAVERFGGHLAKRKLQKGRKQAFAWELHETKAIELLKLAFPYLKVKSWQTMLALTFYREYTPTEPHLRKLGVPPHEIRKRDGYYRLMKKLNSRGKSSRPINQKAQEIIALPSKLNIPYLAALVDGEGWIGIGKTLPTQKYAYRNPHYQLHTGIRMTSRAAVDWVAANYGGNVRHSTSKGNRAPSYIWQVVDGHAIDILRSVFPYLTAKNFHAMMAIAFYYDRTSTYNRRLGVTKDEALKREQYYGLFRKLNARGEKVQRQ